MRKLILLPLLAPFLLVAPSVFAAVTVTKADAPTTPTLNASKLQVIYGGPVVFRGQVPSERGGQRVTLRAATLTPAGTRQTSAVSETTTTGEGNFQFTHVPTALTTYTAVWKSTPTTIVNSLGVSVAVTPRVGLAVVRKLSGRRVVFSTNALSAISYVGRSVYVQRRDSSGKWVSLTLVILRPSTGATNVTVRLPNGLSSIRVLLPAAQAGTGYVAGLSRTIQIVR